MAGIKNLGLTIAAHHPDDSADGEYPSETYLYPSSRDDEMDLSNADRMVRNFAGEWWEAEEGLVWSCVPYSICLELDGHEVEVYRASPLYEDSDLNPRTARWEVENDLTRMPFLVADVQGRLHLSDVDPDGAVDFINREWDAPSVLKQAGGEVPFLWMNLKTREVVNVHGYFPPYSATDRDAGPYAEGTDTTALPGGF